MNFPPSPAQIFLALSFGHISEEEAKEMLKLWHEKHDTKEVEYE